ncbi:hypothetical protein AAFM46_11980 [Arthrobacter sp. TMP15]|uniref:hypothetical protein n=1 Tax=Arthrobacter sp. TMP15 TaxID=3140789 RepID=UPI0031BBA1D6
MTHLAVQTGYVDDINILLEENFSGQYMILPVAFSYKKLQTRRDGISRQVICLVSERVKLMEWDPDIRHNIIWVSVVDYSDSKAALVRQKFGQDIIVKAYLTDGGKEDLFMVK